MLDVAIRTRLGAFTVDAVFTAPTPGVTALFGRSGAGKTSIVRALAGLARPDTGHIRIGETTFFDSARGIDLPAERRRVGYVFQDARLFPHLTVAENLRYGWRRAPPTTAQSHSTRWCRCSASAACSTAARTCCRGARSSGWRLAARSCRSRVFC
jgi:ABC-type molybdate transport system ATPase subunit